MERVLWLKKLLSAKIKGSFIMYIKHDPGMGNTGGQLRGLSSL